MTWLAVFGPRVCSPAVLASASGCLPCDVNLPNVHVVGAVPCPRRAIPTRPLSSATISRQFVWVLRVAPPGLPAAERKHFTPLVLGGIANVGFLAEAACDKFSLPRSVADDISFFRVPNEERAHAIERDPSSAADILSDPPLFASVSVVAGSWFLVRVPPAVVPGALRGDDERGPRASFTHARPSPQSLLPFRAAPDGRARDAGGGADGGPR